MQYFMFMSLIFLGVVVVCCFLFLLLLLISLVIIISCKIEKKKKSGLNFFSKDSNGYLYLRGPYNRGVLIIPRVRAYPTFRAREFLSNTHNPTQYDVMMSSTRSLRNSRLGPPVSTPCSDTKCTYDTLLHV